MIRKRIPIVWVLVLCASITMASAAREGDLTGSLEAFRVVTGNDDEESFLPADEARPNDIIEYRLTYRNNGSESVRDIYITDPIPIGTQYIEQSAKHPPGGSVEFSIDGGETFSAWPIMIVTRDKKGEKKVTAATPEMVTHIRWNISDTFKPQGEVIVSYRTVIK